jgi:acetyl esterase/lipase
MSGSTSKPPVWTGRLAAAWGLLAAAAGLAFTATWVVLPAPAYALLPFGIVAPELSPFLCPAALGVAAASWPCRRRRPGQAAAVLAFTAALVFALPLVQLPATLRRFDAAMSAEGFDAPSSPLGRAPTSVRRAVLVGGGGNTPLTADVYARDGVRGAPLVVQVYGGAWQRGRPGDDETFARYLADRGYVVAAIDYRHAPAARWPAQIEDVRTAIGWLRTHAGELGADPARLALVGRSAGAQLALVAAYQDGAPAVAGVVSFYGPVFLADGWRDVPRPDPLDVRTVLETYLGGTPDDVPRQYEAASPVTYLSATAPPTLLVYATRDHIVKVEFARRLEARLRAEGVPVALLEIPWAEHAFDVLPHGLSARVAFAYVERFLASLPATPGR